MWKGRVASMLLPRRGAKDSWYCAKLSVGAALSLLAITELDKQARDNETQFRMEGYNEQQWPSTTMSSLMSSPSVRCEYTIPSPAHSAAQLVRHSTLRKMEDDSTKASLKSRYKVEWNNVLGEGAFGAVYLATRRETGERVAIKKISKKYTDDESFQREMNALLHLRKAGGHPNICSLREHFNEGVHYYLVLDLISGGEMFDHLVSNGAYSEADAARLVREVASALAFIHGLDTVHGDLKPENLMLSTENPSDAVIKLVDFGCAQVTANDSDFYAMGEADFSSAGKTPAYCPPEVLDPSIKQTQLDPSMDMWALGVILYIMLTGIHPYDLSGKATNEEIECAIVSKKPPPLRNSPITAHLSDSAITLIEKLMSTNVNDRITANEMLEHPWVKGETANTFKMTDSAKKLSMYRAFKSRIQAKVFADIVAWSDDAFTTNRDDVSKRSSLIERTFRSFDQQHKGFITATDLQTLTPKNDVSSSAGNGSTEEDSATLSLSGFSDLLSENMMNRYFPKGHIVYREGDIGNHMYFINSGIIEVSTKEGSCVKRGPGDFFGEGALLHPKRIRSATIRTITPVHAMEISREYFEKYLASSDSGLFLTLREKDKIRKRNRTKTILRLQKDLKERVHEKGDYLFRMGEDGDSMFIVERGEVDVLVGDKKVLTATPGNFTGEHSLITGRQRNSSATCVSDGGCVTQELLGSHFRKLMELSPDMKESIRELCLRRDFKKAVVFRLKKEFPYNNPREAYDAVSENTCDANGLDAEAVGKLMRELNPEYTDDEVMELLRVLDLTYSGRISFDEFKKLFIADIRTSASI